MFKRQPKVDHGGLPRSSKPLLFRKRTAITAIDIEGNQLLAVQASGSRVTKVACGTVEWSTDKGQAAADALAIRKTLDVLHIKPKEAIFCIPRSQVVLRPLQVPMAPDVRELAAIINFQIAKDLPFRVEDAAVDFKVIRAVDAPPSDAESEPQRKLEVLVGAVRADLVRYYSEVAKGAGFKLAGLALRSSGLPRALGSLGRADLSKAALVISLRAEEITIDIVAEGKLAFSRVAAIPPLVENAAADPEKEKFQQQLAVEVVRSLHSYEGSAGFQPIGQVFIVGSTGLETEIAKLLSNRLSLPAEVLTPELPKDAEGTASNAALFSSMGAALAVLDPAGLTLDFANPKKPLLNDHSKRVKIIVTATAAMLALFALVGVRSHLVKKRMAVKLAAQAELTEAEKKLPIYRRLRSQTRVVTTWMADEQNWLDHVAYLSAILPPADQLYVSAVNTTPQHVIRMSVQAKTGELLAELDKKLRAAGYEVRPLSITPANDKHGYNFRTTVELMVPKKMKPDWSKQKPPPRPPDDASLKSAAAQSTRAGGAS